MTQKTSPSPIEVAGKASVTRHRGHEDLQAMITGTLFIGLGMQMYGTSHILTGGTAGLAFLLHYATHWNFSLLLCAVNLPFFALAWMRMGKAFALKTVAAVGLLATQVQLLPQWLRFQTLEPVFAAITGALLIGAGMLMLFRHRASLGGINVLVLYLQEKMGWRAGKVQMGIDCLIVLAAFSVVDAWHVALSVLGAIIMNLTLAVNHRPGRYMGI
jgi:uncharacterized membrane-anchored protein YitT (DUF2179 family)